MKMYIESEEDSWEEWLMKTNDGEIRDLKYILVLLNRSE